MSIAAQRYWRRGEAALSQGHWADAASELQAAFELQPGHVSIARSLAYAQVRQGAIRPAVSVLQSVLSSADAANALLVWSMLGQVLVLDGRPGDAREAFMRCLQLADEMAGVFPGEAVTSRDATSASAAHERREAVRLARLGLAHLDAQTTNWRSAVEHLRRSVRSVG